LVPAGPESRWQILIAALKRGAAQNLLPAGPESLLRLGGTAEEAAEEVVEDARSLPQALKRGHSFQLFGGRLKSGPSQNLREPEFFRNHWKPCSPGILRGLGGLGRVVCSQMADGPLLRLDPSTALWVGSRGRPSPREQGRSS
jgi:hypothetical protein